jgi:hypothetical protein
MGSRKWLFIASTLQDYFQAYSSCMAVLPDEHIKCGTRRNNKAIMLAQVPAEAIHGPCAKLFLMIASTEKYLNALVTNRATEPLWRLHDAICKGLQLRRSGSFRFRVISN